MKTAHKTTTLAALIIATAFFTFQIPIAYADDVAASASVSNSPPVASSVVIDNAASAINLSENTTTGTTIKATISDSNGCEDIDSVVVKFFRTDVGSSVSDDDNNHYTVTASSDGNCTAGGSDLSDTYTANININYYADPTDSGSLNEGTDWTAEVIPTDKTAAGTSSKDTIEMNSLAALNTAGSIAYGSMALGANTGSTDNSVEITNTGNEGIDVGLDGYGSADGDGKAMICSVGSILVANEHYSATSGVDYGSKTSLTDSSVELDLDIPQRTGAESKGTIYWGLGMPSYGVGGSCSGVVVFTADPDPNLD